jgi:hypothetical protein
VKAAPLAAVPGRISSEQAKLRDAAAAEQDICLMWREGPYRQRGEVGGPSPRNEEESDALSRCCSANLARGSRA